MKRTTLPQMKKLGIDPKHFCCPRDAGGFNTAAAQPASDLVPISGHKLPARQFIDC
jgi:hypothetical protein